MVRNRNALVIGAMGVAAAIAGYLVSLQLRDGVPQLAGGTVLPQARPVAQFALIDQEGQPFGNAQLLHGPHLVFFGFTHCPDVCPATLALMAQLKRDAALTDVSMVFVTVDPARDDQLSLLHYVAAFGGNMTALRGTDAALDVLLQSLGAARSIQPLAGGDYAVDHSATLFYINNRAQLRAVFTPPFTLDTLRSDLRALVQTE
jgi:protein SCO1/2